MPVDISASMVSSITDSVLPRIQEWQSRRLSQLYPFVYLDGIHFKVRQESRIVSKCAYIVLGIDERGHKEVLGIWRISRFGPLAKIDLRVLSSGWVY